jgi:hypothetical protein
VKAPSISLAHGEWERITRQRPPDDDPAALAALVLAYVGPVPDEHLDGDAELRRRASTILESLAHP